MTDTHHRQTKRGSIFNSLRWRLLISAGAILLCFILLTGLALDDALKRYTRHAEFDRLQGMAYSLLGAADIAPAGEVTLPLGRVPAPRLQQPGSGLSASIHRDDGKLLWQSPSTLGTPATPPFPGVDQWQFIDHPGFSLHYGLEWIFGDEDSDVQRFSITVSDTASPLQSERARLSYRLWLWLLLISAALLAMLGGLMYWGLKPLQAIRHDLDAIRNGTADRISTSVPDEIQPLTQSLDMLLEHQHNQQLRFRHALSDLAHSLKTPLAVIRNSPAPAQDPVLRQQLQRIDEIVGYQLKRAASAGVKAITSPLPVKPVLLRLQNALGKVYADKGIHFKLMVPEDFSLRIEANDLMELCGNLLDNAAKYGRSEVTIHVREGCLIIDDDGPGFPDNTQRLLQRGQRADNRAAGQGIGLAVADDIAHAYGFKLTLAKAPGGGGRIIITPGEHDDRHRQH